MNVYTSKLLLLFNLCHNTHPYIAPMHQFLILKFKGGTAAVCSVLMLVLWVSSCLTDALKIAES